MLRKLPVCQVTRMSSSVDASAPRDLLSTAYRLMLRSSTSGGQATWLGGSRSSGSNALSGWQWVDGTLPTNIQVTAQGAGLWARSEPNGGSSGVRVCHCRLRSVLCRSMSRSSIRRVSPPPPRAIDSDNARCAQFKLSCGVPKVVGYGCCSIIRPIIFYDLWLY